MPTRQNRFDLVFALMQLPNSKSKYKGVYDEIYGAIIHNHSGNNLRNSIGGSFSGN
jgi:hypothetical protein